MESKYWTVHSEEFQRSGRTLLEKLSFKIKHGCIFFLLGPNGCGKTTFLKMAAGLDAPVIDFLSSEMQVPQRFPERSNWISYLPNQEVEDFGLLSREIIQLGRYGKFSVDDNSSDLNFLDIIIDRLDLKNLLDRRFDTLSLGEKRRISIARVLNQNSPIILMDEPTSALDLGHRERFWSLLIELCKKGKTFILAVHEIDEALRYGNAGLILKNGSQINQGLINEIINEDTLKSVWNLQEIDWILKK